MNNKWQDGDKLQYYIFWKRALWTTTNKGLFFYTNRWNVLFIDTILDLCCVAKYRGTFGKGKSWEGRDLGVWFIMCPLWESAACFLTIELKSVSSLVLNKCACIYFYNWSESAGEEGKLLSRFECHNLLCVCITDLMLRCLHEQEKAHENLITITFGSLTGVSRFLDYLSTAWSH